MMTIDAGIWVEHKQFGEQLLQCDALAGCPCVLGSLAVGSHTTDVADANAVSVMIHTVSTADVHVSTVADGSVSIHNIMVADPVKPRCLCQRSMSAALLLRPSGVSAQCIIISVTFRMLSNFNCSTWNKLLIRVV